MINYQKALLRLRGKLSLSQEDIAKLFGVTFATINRWENGKRVPSKVHMQLLEDLCKKNNITLERY